VSQHVLSNGQTPLKVTNEIEARVQTEHSGPQQNGIGRIKINDDIVFGLRDELKATIYPNNKKWLLNLKIRQKAPLTLKM
jgi:hypothetical protein